MKKLISVWAILFLFLFLAGCNANGDNGDKNNNTNNNSNNNTNEEKETEKEPEKEPVVLKIEDYYPIEDNTKYYYEGSGNEYATYQTYIDYHEDGKFQQRSDNGGTVMANVFQLQDGKLTKVFSRGEAYYRENLLKKTGEEEVLLMEPLEKGTTWKLSDGRERTITNTSVDITTPAGNYKAIEVTTEGDKDKTMDYYAPNLGLVKSVFTSEGMEVTSTLSKIEENVPIVENIRFYYPNIDDGKYYYKTKQISFKTNDITRQTLETAYKEPGDGASNIGKVLSDKAKINSLYLHDDQNVYIDMNRDFVTNMNAGARYEQMILQSIANTFGQYYNAPKVNLTIDNNAFESGHITMSKSDFIKVDIEGAVEIK